MPPARATRRIAGALGSFAGSVAGSVLVGIRTRTLRVAMMAGASRFARTSPATAVFASPREQLVCCTTAPPGPYSHGQTQIKHKCYAAHSNWPSAASPLPSLNLRLDQWKRGRRHVDYLCVAGAAARLKYRHLTSSGNVNMPTTKHLHKSTLSRGDPKLRGRGHLSTVTFGDSS